MWNLLANRKRVNLVLGGGGAKGMGLVGAMAALEERGYEFECIAGCSVGAVIGALKAAGMDTACLRETIEQLEASAFLDNAWAERLGPVAKGAAVMARR